MTVKYSCKLEIKEPRNCICHAAVQPAASVLSFMLIQFLKQRQSVMVTSSHLQMTLKKATEIKKKCVFNSHLIALIST